MKEFLRSVNIRNLLALIIVLTITFLSILPFFVVFPKENEQLIQSLFDKYTTLGFGVVVGFYFISSKNEADRQRREHAQQEQRTITEDDLLNFPALVKAGYKAGDSIPVAVWEAFVILSKSST